MKIYWVNHASYITEVPGFTMICDPWIEGRVFNRSWAHLLPSGIGYEQFSDINHIWFSHEHPDHFFPPNLQKIDPAIRTKIRILYQKTRDAKVTGYCRKLGFGEIKELAPWEWTKLRDDVHVLNAKVRNDTDSWLVLKAEGLTMVNVNDCVFTDDEDLDRIASEAGEVDVLFTQFSFASWVGNPDDPDRIKAAAAEKLEEIGRQIRVLKPKYVVPFASYVWFCHRDNYFMNQHANTIEKVVTFLINLNVTPIVLAPGDQWEVGIPWDNSNALSRYREGLERIRKQKDLTVPEIYNAAQLMELAKIWSDKGLKRNSAFKLKNLPKVTIWVNDIQQAFELSYRSGLGKIELTENRCDVSLSSDSLKYCLDFDWGWDTIQIAGTFIKPAKGNFMNYQEYQWVGNLNNQGKRLDIAAVRILKQLFQA